MQLCVQYLVANPNQSKIIEEPIEKGGHLTLQNELIRIKVQNKKMKNDCMNLQNKKSQILQ